MKTDLQPSHNVSEQLEEILRNRINACRQALQDPEPHKGIHEARKQLKKIRAMIRIIRDDVPKQTYQQANTYFRNVARLLSGARDTSALLEVTMTLHHEVKASEVRALLERIVRHFMAKKAAVTRYQIKRDQLLQHTLDELAPAETYIPTSHMQHEGFDALAAGIHRVYKRCQRMSEQTKQHPAPENFHEWRKRVKYLRYQLNALEPVWPSMMDVLEDELHTLTDALGADHDLYVLHETIFKSKLKEQQDWTPLFHFIANQRKQHQTRAHSLGNQLFYWPPSRFVGWLETIWTERQQTASIPEESLVEV